MDSENYIDLFKIDNNKEFDVFSNFHQFLPIYCEIINEKLYILRKLIQKLC